MDTVAHAALWGYWGHVPNNRGGVGCRNKRVWLVLTERECEGRRNFFGLGKVTLV